MYKYRLLILVEFKEVLIKSQLSLLQSEFDDGWEYVDKISQTSPSPALIAIVLRKKQMI